MQCCGEPGDPYEQDAGVPSGLALLGGAGRVPAQAGSPGSCPPARCCAGERALLVKALGCEKLFAEKALILPLPSSARFLKFISCFEEAYESLVLWVLISHQDIPGRGEIA